MEQEQKPTNLREEKFGGRKFWRPAMEEPEKEEIFQPQEEADIRLKKLEITINTIKNQFSNDEKQNIKAIILYGSVARGAVMHPKADIDIHIDMDPYDTNIFIVSEFEY